MGKIFEFPYRTVAEVNLQALARNLFTLRSCSRKEIIPVVKADAYGHGMIPVAKVLLNRGCCEVLAVATLEEALELRAQFDRPFQILVLSGYLPHQLDAYYRHHLTPVIHTMSHLKTLVGRDKLPPLHLKIDTGMNRLGLKPEEIPEAMEALAKLPDKLAGLMTHFSDSEELGSTFVDEQLAIFDYWYRELRSRKLLATDARIHCSNSGGVLRDKTGPGTSVRPGLSLYGISPGPQLEGRQPLVPVLQWKTRILAFKNTNPGESVGYCRTYRSEKPERLAIIPVGYADGYPRLAGNRGYVLIGGKRAPVRGMVSMDLTAVDVTGLEDVREGSLVSLIGGDGNERITASEIASWAGTISYEILCGISRRVQRIYFDSDAI